MGGNRERDGRIERTAGRTQTAGRRGETLAAEYLTRSGFVILAANYRFQRNEIDLVARGEGFLVFIEVKLRRTAAFGGPEAAVHRAKQAAIASCARGFIRQFRLDGVPCRFDVVAIREMGGDSVDVEHIRNAFSAPF
jgi:putative endonuclease